jgi:hypothetical protein
MLRILQLAVANRVDCNATGWESRFEYIHLWSIVRRQMSLKGATVPRCRNITITLFFTARKLTVVRLLYECDILDAWIKSEIES